MSQPNRKLVFTERQFQNNCFHDKKNKRLSQYKFINYIHLWHLWRGKKSDWCKRDLWSFVLQTEEKFHLSPASEENRHLLPTDWEKKYLIPSYKDILSFYLFYFKCASACSICAIYTYMYNTQYICMVQHIFLKYSIKQILWKNLLWTQCASENTIKIIILRIFFILKAVLNKYFFKEMFLK